MSSEFIKTCLFAPILNRNNFLSEKISLLEEVIYLRKFMVHYYQDMSPEFRTFFSESKFRLSCSTYSREKERENFEKLELKTVTF